MRAVVQRVTRASVAVDGEVVGEIERGLCVFVGAGRDDDHRDVSYMAAKLVGLRIFADDADKMNLAVGDVGGSVLLVSQFTLFGDVRSGRRPGFEAALEPEGAEQLYQQLIEEIQALDVQVACGRFRASMRVSLDNDGPVTILIDSKKTF